MWISRVGSEYFPAAAASAASQLLSNAGAKAETGDDDPSKRTRSGRA